MTVLTPPANSPQSPDNLLILRRTTDVKPLVLIADDHSDTRFMLKFQLGRWGCRAVEAGDGEKAVHLCQTTGFDLILMDVQMPRFDGLAAANEIRQFSGLNRQTPIVFITARTEQNARTAAIAVGGSAYLVKPFDLADLEIVLTQYLKLGTVGKNVVYSKSL